jgi:PPOX class probable F420-dependent enzyme
VNVAAWAVELLATARVGRLATASAAGQPLVVPVCYVVEAGRIYWAVDAKPKRTQELRRLRNIADNPRVSLVVDEWDEDWGRLRWVMVDGTAAVLPEGTERTRALAALVAKYPQYAAMDLARVAGAVIVITPTDTRAWTAAKEMRP